MQPLEFQNVYLICASLCITEEELLIIMSSVGVMTYATLRRAALKRIPVRPKDY